MEAIILAGGLGTRLQHISKDTPKSMALIKGRPFLEIQLDLLIEQGVKRFVLSVGYKSDQIQQHFGAKYKNCEIVYAVEEELLGTGGAIKNAMQYTDSHHVIVANGDSLVINDLESQFKFHIDNSADATLALKKMKNFERYGTVDLNKNDRIVQFNEKQPVKEGLINVGVYIFDKTKFLSHEWPSKFSIEKDYFESMSQTLNFFGKETKAYFLDIGIPSDYQKAQTEIGTFLNIQPDWTLFLDRDGVINKKRDNDYVKTLKELELFPKALKAIAELTPFFHKIIIVTNQQGIGKGLMTEEALAIVHKKVIEEIEKEGGRIDEVYFAPDLAGPNNHLRKPNIGMAEQAKSDFPSIDLNKSIMVGDSISDMEFGENAGMTQVFIQKNTHKKYYTVSSLEEFSNTILTIKNAH